MSQMEVIKPCNCGREQCIGSRKLIGPFRCVREAGIEAIRAENSKIVESLRK